jgi:hypothetical protein
MRKSDLGTWSRENLDKERLKTMSFSYCSSSEFWRNALDIAEKLRFGGGDYRVEMSLHCPDEGNRGSQHLALPLPFQDVIREEEATPALPGACACQPTSN